ncbi:MAG: glycerophosphodiester phosphodiesterase [Magnetococcales bacterium]|nr:glycerophosphodiester phosphodiesterase [Magnetococcales bacterium]
MSGMERERWVAHRGIPARHPENGLEGLRAALRAGARFVEFDIRLTRDWVPVLLHDADLARTSGVRGRVAGMDWEEVRAATDVVPSLAEAAELLREYPLATAFVEIKHGALTRGVARAAGAIVAPLSPIRGQVVLISFHAGVLRHLRATGGWPIGWIFESYGFFNRQRAMRLAPEYLFADQARIPAGEALFAGPWQWALYEVSDPDLAWNWRQRGADLIETNDFTGMVTGIC